MRTLVISILLSFILSGCINPANFWDEFDSKHQISSTGEFDGRYGFKVVHFKRQNNPYKLSEIIDFASKNDWELLDSTFLSSKLLDTSSSVINNELKFNACIRGFETNVEDCGFTKVFPRYISSGLTVYEFNTSGMILVDSYTQESSQWVGFVLLSKDRLEMTAYHLWGETHRHY